MMNVRRREEKTKEFLFTEYNCCDGVNDLLSNSECLLQLLICKDGMDKGNQFQISPKLDSNRMQAKDSTLLPAQDLNFPK